MSQTMQVPIHEITGKIYETLNSDSLLTSQDYLNGKGKISNNRTKRDGVTNPYITQVLQPVAILTQQNHNTEYTNILNIFTDLFNDNSVDSLRNSRISERIKELLVDKTFKVGDDTGVIKIANNQPDTPLDQIDGTAREGVYQVHLTIWAFR